MPNSHTILIVEDDHSIRTTLRLILENEGFQVLEAANGYDALNLLSPVQLPQVILLDLMMPVMNGWEFSEQISKNSCYSNIPIIVVSAYSEKMQKIRCAEVVTKPIDLDLLLPIVHRLCEKQVAMSCQ